MTPLSLLLLIHDVQPVYPKGMRTSAQVNVEMCIKTQKSPIVQRTFHETPCGIGCE